MNVQLKKKENIVKLLSGYHSRILRDEKLLPLLTTVSGVATTKPSLISFFDSEIPSIDIITTKSFQVLPNPGNREPIICEIAPGNFGNSVGLRNPGLKVALEELKELRRKHQLRAWLNVSVSANSPEDFITLVRAFDEVADSIELNFSCPHASTGFGASIGCDEQISSSYVKAIKNATKDCTSPIFVKLTPNVDDIGRIAKAVVEAGADGLVAINTTGPEIHIEPHAQAPILQNKLGGKGGCSGAWVFSRALEVVREIRQAVGEQIPLIGMGGVSTGKDAALLIQAGADAVGIGSAFGTVHQRDWQTYTHAVKTETFAVLHAQDAKVDAAKFINPKRQMQYTPHRIESLVHHTSDIVIMTLTGGLDFHPGQFVFLWIPTIGEKPFSVAEVSPLTFIIKKRGEFTEALCALHEGDTLYVRGLYGDAVTTLDKPEALLIGGGTGVAVLPELAKKLANEGASVTVLTGTSTTEQTADGKALLEDSLSRYGTFISVPDDGKPGRVLDCLAPHVPNSADLACYIVGPEKFMSMAARNLVDLGVPSSSILLSMERMTLCGIGMCGECVCAGRLPCQWGTFMNYEYLCNEAPELL